MPHERNPADGVELTTDEVLRSGAERLRSSRDVLSMIDDALHKSRRVLEDGAARELRDTAGAPQRPEDANRPF